MSTSRLLKPGQRPADYTNIGYAGRKTGVVLKDTGDRDEYGMPNIDDLFSPPPQSESSLKKVSLVNGTSRAIAGEELNHVSDFQQDATTYSSPRKSLPPRARSPIKTSIGSPRKSINGSPKKTMALLASPVRMKATIQADSNDRERANRNAFMSNKHKRRSLELAPKRPPGAASTIQQPNQQHILRRSLFDIPSSPALVQPSLQTNDLPPGISGTDVRRREQSVTPHLSASAVKKAEKADTYLNGTTAVASGGRAVQGARLLRATDIESLPKANGQPHVNRQYNIEEGEKGLFVKQRNPPPVISDDEPILPTELLQKSKQRGEEKGRRRFSDIEAAERAPPPQPVVQLDVDDYEFQPDIGGFDGEEIDFGPEHEVSIEADGDMDALSHDSPSDLPAPLSTSPPAISAPSDKSPQSKFPNPTLKRRSPSHDDIQEETPSPTKKQRQSTNHPMPPPTQPTLPIVNEQEKTKTAPIFDKTKQGKRQITLEPVPQPPAPTSPFRKSRPKGRGLQIVKNKAESEADGARYTRSGRTSVKPVEYWRGERVIYTAPRREKGRVSLPGIQDVIRIEDEPRTRKPTTKRKPSKHQQREPSIEPQDEPEQEWEIEPGVFAGEIPSWDPEKQRGDPEYSEQVDLAIAPRGWEALTKEVQGASFQFAKALTLPFFHAGMVDLPPGGEKTSKNSRRNHMAFLVVSGRVVVDVSGNQFSLGREGFWQVPRGNTYSMRNPYDKPARIFFSQACHMTETEGAAYEEAEVAGAAQE